MSKTNNNSASSSNIMDLFMDVKPEVTIIHFDEENVNRYLEKIDLITSKYGAAQPIIFKIDSFGGSIYGLSALYERIVSLPNPIITYTASKAMSAGAILLSSAGSKGLRVATPNASIMIHEIQTGAIGDIKNVENEVEYSKVENTKWMDILAKSMGLKSANDIRNLIKENKGHELYLTSEQALKLGVIDEIAYLHLNPINFWEVQKAQSSVEVPLIKKRKPRKK